MRKPWLTLESVQQDLQAAVLVANLENLLSQEAQEQLSAGDRQRQYPLRVNKAVSYHALKERIFDLLMNRRGNVDEALSQLQLWMKNSPVSRRIGRPGPERKKNRSPAHTDSNALAARMFFDFIVPLTKWQWAFSPGYHMTGLRP